ncbi:MAG: hypothetical protein LQ340_003644 [Diploschistes diacapsis]|nr:MAG: hypothetical protein LQ340_003644 [Diploschistes diacapsis]
MSSPPTSSTSVRPGKISSESQRQKRRDHFRSSSLGSFIAGGSRHKAHWLSPSPKNPYELAPPGKKGLPHDMVRTVGRDDTLIARGANPRTGVISPRATASLDSNQDYIESKSEQGPTSAQGKWKQDSSGWSLVDAIPTSEPTYNVEEPLSVPKPLHQSRGDAELFRRYHAEYQRGLRSCGPGNGLVDPLDPPKPRDSTSDGPSSPRPSLFKIRRKPIAQEPERRNDSTGTVVINGGKPGSSRPALGRLMREGHVNIVTPKHSPPRSVPSSGQNKRDQSPFLGQHKQARNPRNLPGIQAKLQLGKLNPNLQNSERSTGPSVASYDPQWAPQNMTAPTTPRQVSSNRAYGVRSVLRNPTPAFPNPSQSPPKQVRFNSVETHHEEETRWSTATTSALDNHQACKEAPTTRCTFPALNPQDGSHKMPRFSTAQDVPTTITTTTTLPDLKVPRSQRRGQFGPEAIRYPAADCVPRVKQLRACVTVTLPNPAPRYVSPSKSIVHNHSVPPSPTQSHPRSVPHPVQTHLAVQPQCPQNIPVNQHTANQLTPTPPHPPLGNLRPQYPIPPQPPSPTRLPSESPRFIPPIYQQRLSSLRAPPDGPLPSHQTAPQLHTGTPCPHPLSSVPVHGPAATPSPPRTRPPTLRTKPTAHAAQKAITSHRLASGGVLGATDPGRVSSELYTGWVEMRPSSWSGGDKGKGGAGWLDGENGAGRRAGGGEGGGLGRDLGGRNRDRGGELLAKGMGKRSGVRWGLEESGSSSGRWAERRRVEWMHWMEWGVLGVAKAVGEMVRHVSYMLEPESSAKDATRRVKVVSGKGMVIEERNALSDFMLAVLYFALLVYLGIVVLRAGSLAFAWTCAVVRLVRCGLCFFGG